MERSESCVEREPKTTTSFVNFALFFACFHEFFPNRDILPGARMAALRIWVSSILDTSLPRDVHWCDGSLQDRHAL